MDIGKLFFVLTKKCNPYNQNACTEIWGEIKLIYEFNRVQKEILSWQWDILEVKEWFVERKNSLKSYQINVLNEEKKSIAELRDVAYNREFFFSEEELVVYYDTIEKIFAPFQFHLRGTPTPTFYIGLNENWGEISFFNKEGEKYERFNFEIGDFIDNLSKELGSVR